MNTLLVVLGAMVGAPLRYLTDRAVQTKHDSIFPWGTFTVNLIGCMVLGGLAGAAVSTPVFALVGTGFCGALTTYSTFSFETVRLAEQRAYMLATMNILVSVIAGLGATLLSYTAFQAMF